MPERLVELILFDLDGTLVDSREDIVSSVNHTLRRMDREERSFQEVVSYIGTGVKDLIRDALGDDDPGLIETGVEIFSGHFERHCADKSRLYPHVKEILEHFKARELIVLTNRRAAIAGVTLRKLGLDGYFNDIKGGDDEKCLKPDACPISRVLSTRPGKRCTAMMVGDMALDIHAGKEAGVLTCGVTYGIGARADLERAKPDFIIDDLIQLKDLIK